MNQWYEGIPPVEAVEAHETLHPRKDGVVGLGELMVSYDENDHRYPNGDARIFGQWIVYPNCAKNPAVQGGDAERGERSSPNLNSAHVAARCIVE